MKLNTDLHPGPGSTGSGPIPPGATDLSVSMIAANLRALVFIVPAGVLLAGLYGGIHGWGPLLRTFPADLLPLLGALAVAVVLHEAIHGIVWVLAGRKRRESIRFGVQWQTLTPYANCTEPMEVGAYRLGAMAPGILLGVLPAVAGIATGNAPAFILGAVMTLAAGGDALILWLIRNVPRGAQVQDHPARAGCYVLPDAAGHTGAA